jgi:hypothetical protein
LRRLRNAEESRRGCGYMAGLKGHGEAKEPECGREAKVWLRVLGAVEMQESGGEA